MHTSYQKSSYNSKSTATMKIPMPKWRKREAAVVNSVFCGEPLPSPPNEVLTPIEYFKSFFDDQLIAHISEQTNLYSVQKNGSSVATTADEIEQFIGQAQSGPGGKVAIPTGPSDM
eukprot:gene6428-biopygen8027